MSWLTASASSPADSASADRRTGEASATPEAVAGSARVCPSSSGGSHSTKLTAPRGAASSVTAVTGNPVSRAAVPAGSPVVAEASRNTGAPASRRSRRSRWATCEPNTPRYACTSSTTTYASCFRNSRHCRCPGRIPQCSMSGFVNTKRACARIHSRSSPAGQRRPQGGRHPVRPGRRRTGPSRQPLHVRDPPVAVPRPQHVQQAGRGRWGGGGHPRTVPRLSPPVDAATAAAGSAPRRAGPRRSPATGPAGRCGSGCPAGAASGPRGARRSWRR